MKPYYHIVLTLVLIACNGNLQNNYEELFSHSVSQYANLDWMDWEIDYSNSVKWSDEHYEIEADANRNDTLCGVTFAIFPRKKDTFVNIIEYVEFYTNDDYQYYTSFDSAFVPVYKYKYQGEYSDSVVFLFGEDRFFNGGIY